MTLARWSYRLREERATKSTERNEDYISYAFKGKEHSDLALHVHIQRTERTF